MGWGLDTTNRPRLFLRRIMQTLKESYEFAKLALDAMKAINPSIAIDGINPGLIEKAEKFIAKLEIAIEEQECEIYTVAGEVKDGWICTGSQEDREL